MIGQPKAYSSNKVVVFRINPFRLCINHQFCNIIQNQLNKALCKQMSYKSLTNSRQSRRDRKVSANSLQTFTCDSEQQITPSPYSQKAHKQVTPSEYSGRWRDQQENEQNIVSINIYNEHFVIDCNDEHSIAQFMNHLNQIASINIKTKISLILMISQRAYQVNKEHSILLKRTLQEYQRIEIQEIFN